jgi:hypothetical protein
VPEADAKLGGAFAKRHTRRSAGLRHCAGCGALVSAATFAEAEKLVQFELSPSEREQAAGNWRRSMAPLYERRTGPRKFSPPASVAPASRWDPVLPGQQPATQRDRFIRTTSEPRSLSKNDQYIVFAPLPHLSRWIETRQLTSERLTRLYLDRLQRFNPKLNCVITLTSDLALSQAQQADREIAAGHYRGPLHGIPWGAKDLLDTAGIPTTYGAEPYRNRVPTQDAVVVKRLHDAGAVLVAKLSLGALALNDIWFGGQTVNPWLLEEGSAGSSAGPGAATAAGLVGFAIGSETGGSLIDPAMRCGVSALRPTFGRVPRTGAMTLCWSLDKLGPMTRGVEDGLLVLQAISGPDPGDVGSVPSHLDFDASAPVNGLRVGYFPGWMKEAPATDVDRAGSRDHSQTRHDPNRGVASGLALRFAPTDSVCRGRGRFRGAHGLGRPQATQNAGSRCLAQQFPSGPLPIRCRLRSSRPISTQRGSGNGPHLFSSGSAASPVAARRNAHPQQLHRSSVSHSTGRLRERIGGA